MCGKDCQAKWDEEGVTAGALEEVGAHDVVKHAEPSHVVAPLALLFWME